MKTGLIYIFISIYSDNIFLGDSDDGSIGVIVGAVVGGIMGIMSVAVIVILSMILWHHCKRHKEKNTPGSYIYMCVCVCVCISLGTIVPNSRDRQGKLWLRKKQKTALKTTLQ